MHRRSVLLLPLLAALRAPQARAEPVAPRLTLTAGELVAGDRSMRLRPGIALPATPAGLPPVDPTDDSPEAGLLRRAVAQGRAAGPAGVVYDNRDRDHSALRPGLFPPMTRLAYGADLTARNLDYGLAVPILLPGPRALAPVLGNSSTAVTGGTAPRSLPRLAMTTPEGPARAFAAYAGNQTYIYPEHRDHDAEDLFPANWPYMLISQGSSGSDSPLLRAAGMILGGLSPAVRAEAEARGLIGPTVQMLFRRGQVRGQAAAYLSGAAHPTVFDGAGLNPAAMLRLAQDLQPGDLPPLVRLAVLTEEFSPAAGLAGMTERLFDTPSAIARVWRGPAYRRDMRLAAAADGAAPVRRWHWVLLRGDPDRVRITPEGHGNIARISLDWHDAAGLAAGPTRTGLRVDIGVFAETAGGQFSAPALLSVSFPRHELRRYGPGPDQSLRLMSVDHDAAGRGTAFDPLLHWSAPWRDEMIWAPDGSLAGWTRVATSAGGLPAAGHYDAAGARDGRRVYYVVAGAAGSPVLTLQ